LDLAGIELAEAKGFSPILSATLERDLASPAGFDPNIKGRSWAAFSFDMDFPKLSQ
jgi:hypothetical protein